MSGLISIIISLVIVGLIVWLCMWFIGVVGLPEPFAKVATVLIALCALIYLIGILTGSVPTIRLAG